MNGRSKSKLGEEAYVSDARPGRGLPMPRPTRSTLPRAHLCLRLAARLESWAVERRS